MKHYSVLVVDDEPGIRESLASVLQDEGYRVDAVETGEACLEKLGKKRFDLVLLDIWLPGIDGVRTLEKIQATESPPLIIMISGHGTIDAAVRSTKLGAFDFLEKPLSIDKTLLTLRHAVEQLKLTAQNRLLRDQLEGQHRIIGDSVPMKALRQQLGLAAPTSGRVLVYGESGTGKELVARALHNLSPRAQQLFVEVNCAAIPEELIESELFGHVKGSFTGAVEDKVGKFAQADTGTLFLDEVGDMSLRTQSKVLRVIEEQRFTPIGSGNNLTVDVRVIAATNKNLEEEIQKGNFREDLFYRLNVIPFYVPPLREHPEDIPALANYFLGEFARAYGRRPKHFSESALETILHYRWPGNVRELKNLVERMVIMVPGERIERRHLPPNLYRDPGRSGPPRPGTSGFSSLQEARAAYERDYILRKLQENHGNVSRTAEVLGLERSHLYRKMKSLGVTLSE
ncbi:MAG: Fis family transcriptional regulator [Acidobacteria bacterium 13_1_40CM_2_60_7]|nr:MAG: Fis family transcriptional regulator [Acidobacteria bacterium 13_1_40CM_2_60_7]OLE85521.1 MAG: Fis family transcriptional regulator [Acidobacteria bacterium 13_1_20CM_2_60_10]